jgi:hypothetical protein
VAIVIVKVVLLGTEVTMNFSSSNVAFVKVDPDKPETASNNTISLSSKPWLEETVIVTVGDPDVLVKFAPVIVVLIG